MEEGKQCRIYPEKGRPDIILENDEGVQVTGQAARQKMRISEIVPAVEAAWGIAEKTFPQYSLSPVYLCTKGELPVGWFRMEMPDKEMIHIKAFSSVEDEMVMLTFTYPDKEDIKWKSMILYSFGTWREFHGEN